MWLAEYSGIVRTLRGGPGGSDRRQADDELRGCCVCAAHLLVQLQTTSAAEASWPSRHSVSPVLMKQCSCRTDIIPVWAIYCCLSQVNIILPVMTQLSYHVTLFASDNINPLIITLKLQSMVRRGADWAVSENYQAPPRCTECNGPPINGQCIMRWHLKGQVLAIGYDTGPLMAHWQMFWINF